MSNKDKIVLTGANGFLGSHLVDRLLKEDVEIHCIVRKSSSLKWLNGKNVVLHTCGLNDKKALAEVLKNVDYLFHLAGTTAAFTYEEYYDGNVKLTQKIFDALILAQANPKKIVVTSSQAVTGPSQHNLIDETSQNPISFYAKSKLEQEKLCVSYFDQFNISIARPSIIYGPRDTEFFEFIKTVKAGIVPLVGGKDIPISSIYVTDLVEGIYQMAVQEIAKGQIYHIASAEVLTWRDLGQIIAKELNKQPVYLKVPISVLKIVSTITEYIGKAKGKPATLNREKAKEGKQIGYVCSVEKAKLALGFSAKISAEEGLKASLDWYKLNNWI